MFWDGTKLHHGCTVEIRDVFQSKQLRNGGAAAGVDEKTIGGEQALLIFLFSNENGAGAREFGVAEDQIEVGSFLDAMLAAIAEEVDDIALAFADTKHVNARRSDLDSVIGTAAGEISDAAASDHGFRGSAAFIDA